MIATLSIPWRHLIGIGLVFIRKILLPNRMHIQLVMQLSDTITDRVVYSIDFLLNEWNGDDKEENDEDVNVRFEKFFSVEDLDF